MRYRVGRVVAVVAAILVTTGGTAGTQSRAGAHTEAQREKWQRVTEIFDAMLVRPGAVVADVGAGDGFFTVRLARAVGPEGRVLAVDIGDEPLRRLRTRAADEDLRNVEVIEGAADDPRLPAASVDAVLIVNAYHEMTEHKAMLAKIRAALKPGGRLVIVEPIAPSRRDASREQQTRNHEIAAAFVRDDVAAASFIELSLVDPFTTRPQGSDQEWMLVLTPAQPAQTFSSKNEEWKAPELRIGVDEFKRLHDRGDVLVVDVRDPESYRQGHLPGAVLITPEELSKPQGIDKLRGEKRLIVTYCS